MDTVYSLTIPDTLVAGITYARSIANAAMAQTVESEDGPIPNPALYATDFAYFQARMGDVLNSWEAARIASLAVEPEPIPVSGVPQEVTRRQAMQALINRGKLEIVRDAIAAIPDAVMRATVENEFANSMTFQRNRETTLLIAQAAGIEDLDEWFTYADTL